MRESGLEKEKIGLKEIFEEIRYAGLSHYMNDLFGHLIDGSPIHYHKLNHTSPKNKVIHSYIYSMKRRVSEKTEF